MAQDRQDLQPQYKFVVEPDESLKCLICLEVANDPLQHEGCGKLFCKECLEKHGRDQPCPNCRGGAHFYVDNRSEFSAEGRVEPICPKCRGERKGGREGGIYFTLNIIVVLTFCKGSPGQ